MALLVALFVGFRMAVLVALFVGFRKALRVARTTVFVDGWFTDLNFY